MIRVEQETIIFKQDLYRKFLLFSILPLLLLSLIFIVLLIKEKYDLISSSHTNIIQNIQYNINRFNEEIKEIPNLLKEIDGHERKKVLNGIVKYKEFINTVIILNKEGIVQEISSRKNTHVFAKYDYSNKNIFINYKKNKKDFLTNIYFSNFSDIPLISYVFGFNEEVYIIELSLDFINKLVSNITQSRIDNLSITIIDKNGLYILDSENNLNVKNRNSFYTSKLYKDVISVNEKNSFIRYLDDSTEKNNYMSYQELNDFSWTILINENNNDIDTYIKNISLMILLIILLIAFITIKSARKIAHSIVNPLEVLTLNINRFSNDHSSAIDENLRSKYTMFSILIKDFKDLQKSIIKNEQSLRQQIIENKHKDKILSEQSKMAAMGEMMGNIAHQWRQPLSVISTAATGMIVQKEFKNFDDNKLIPTCKIINENAQYLSKTIDDFKNFIKGDRVKKVFKLSDNIRSTMNLLESTIKNNSIDIIYELEEDIEIDGYDNELTQCFINICNNAKDALISNNIEDKYIFIKTEKVDDRVIIKIKDNAEGIAENILPHIFEPYFTTKHKSQGTGLGLHMTYNLITDGMKGSIEAFNVSYWYGNEEYTGTEFIICL